ncbi:MAG: tryptophan-rich sensory protein [Myxococcales bacterium]|nr:tryptophan-rich sensory protein [Myxococcales bacterium]
MVQGTAFFLGINALARIGGSHTKEICADLDTPSWAPPAWLFGPAWTINDLAPVHVYRAGSERARGLERCDGAAHRHVRALEHLARRSQGGVAAARERWRCHLQHRRRRRARSVRRAYVVAVGTVLRRQPTRTAPRTDPSERHYRTGLLPRVLASKRSSGQG